MKRFLAVVLLAFSAPALAGPTDEAAAAWRRGEYSRAAAIWGNLAQSGNVDALYNLGQAHRLGKGVPQDMAAAVKYYRRAHQGGHSRAGEQLGLILFGADGTRSEALELLARAAREGAPRASYVMGIEHLEGKNVRRDAELARTYLARAAAAGIPNAREALARIPAAGESDRGVGASPGSASPSAVALVSTMSPVDAVKVARPSASAMAPGGVAATSDEWMISLGEFATMSTAAFKWVKISARQKLESHNVRFDQTGRGVHVAFGPFAEAAARSFCVRLVAARVSCTPFVDRQESIEKR